LIIKSKHEHHHQNFLPPWNTLSVSVFKKQFTNSTFSTSPTNSTTSTNSTFSFFMKKIKMLCVLLALVAAVTEAQAQPERWQQRVKYTMDIDVNADAHQYAGKMKLAYTNNSPDVLTRAFWHLYFNAFKPNSMMAVRTGNIADPDKRMANRINTLPAEEQGFIKVKSLKMNGLPCVFEENETILEVTLPQPIGAGQTVTFDMEWDAQVPVQIRRSGRDNSEGVEFSMSQWYPKLCEYDVQGWHANPYIAREFYGVWGDYDVTIRMDKKYMVAAGGYLQNPQEVGWGYEKAGAPLRLPTGDKLTWRFLTPNVHDFAWAADPDYTQTTRQAQDGSLLRFVWQKGKGYDEQWEKLPAIMDRARTIMNENCGKYPYNEYAFIQGGDGGMEYPMATLITGNRPLGSLVGVSVHEQLHSWYQMVLGTNESLHAWMDEGFTSWASELVENQLKKEGLMPGTPDEQYWVGALDNYAMLANSGQEEPLTTHADHFDTNYGYSLAAYVKGAVFLTQMEYIVGKEAFQKGLLRYFDTWKFKHPNPTDCVRVFEKQSGLELDWYQEDWCNTTNTVDYGIQSVTSKGGKATQVVIERVGRMAMPLDIVVTYTDGRQEIFYAPLEGMRGLKPAEDATPRTVLPDHRWVDKKIEFEIPAKAKTISKIEIDPSRRMADVSYDNNVLVQKK
jgi:Peptidase family M1 domain